MGEANSLKCHASAGVAQLVEQLIRNEKVGCSIHLSGTNFARRRSWVKYEPAEAKQLIPFVQQNFSCVKKSSGALTLARVEDPDIFCY